MLGNCFYSFDYIFRKQLEDPNWLQTINLFFENFGLKTNETHLIISLIIGAVIPLISLFFLKSTTDWVNSNKNADMLDSTKNTNKVIDKSLKHQNFIDIENDWTKDNILSIK